MKVMLSHGKCLYAVHHLAEFFKNQWDMMQKVAHTLTCRIGRVIVEVFGGKAKACRPWTLLSSN